MWCLNPLLPTAMPCCCPHCVRWAFTGCHASFRWESWGAGKLTVRAGWQDPSLCGQWPWREMKEVHVHTLAAQTGLQSSVKALLPVQPCCFSSAPFLHPLSLIFDEVQERVWCFNSFSSSPPDFTFNRRSAFVVTKSCVNTYTVCSFLRVQEKFFLILLSHSALFFIAATTLLISFKCVFNMRINVFIAFEFIVKIVYVHSARGSQYINDWIGSEPLTVSMYLFLLWKSLVLYHLHHRNLYRSFPALHSSVVRVAAQ